MVDFFMELQQPALKRGLEEGTGLKASSLQANSLQASTAHKSIKIALLRAPIIFAKGALNNEATPAIGYAYISSFLKKNGHQTVIIDGIGEGLNSIWSLQKYPNMYCQGLTFKEIKSRIPLDVDVICFSGMFSGEWPVIRDLINEVHEGFKDKLFVIGGEHVTVLSEYSLKDCPALDICVLGEGEQTILKIINAYAAGNSIHNIPGTAYINEAGEFCQVGSPKDSRVLNINELSWPDWPEGYLEKFWSNGKSCGVGSARDMPFLFSRGCPFECTFCSNAEMWGRRYLLRDIDNIIEEIKYYIAKYNITSLQLYDLTAIVNRQWVLDFCDRFKKTNIKINWSLPSGTRSEALDAEVLKALKEVGLNYVVYAPESGSRRTLKMIKKRVNLDHLTASALAAKKLGLACRTNLIIGFPGETWKDIFQTIFYGLKMAIKGIDEVPFYVFSPYPGTEIFKNLMTDKQLTINDDYFFSLTSLNSSYLSLKTVKSFNPKIKSWKLGMIRIFFILTTYFLSYAFYPKRIIRTIRNLSSTDSTTVFEHRLKDLIKRKKLPVGI